MIPDLPSSSNLSQQILTDLCGRTHVLVFAPYADMWVHHRNFLQFCERIAQSTLVTIVACDGARHSTCVAMRASRINENLADRKDEICGRCLATSKIIPSKCNFLALSDVRIPTPTIPTGLAELLDFEYRGIPLGRTSVYEYLLAEKKSHLDLAGHDVGPVRSVVRDSVEIFEKTKVILETTGADAAVVNNDLYSFNAAFIAAAEMVRVSTVNLEMSDFRSRSDRSVRLESSADATMYRGIASPTDMSASGLPLKTTTKLVKKELFTRLNSRHALNYGSFANRDLNFKKAMFDRPRVVFAMSSSDELRTFSFVRGRSFSESEQIVALESVCRIAAELPDIEFVVRPHPRLFRNRRESNLAKEWDRIDEVLCKFGGNIVIDRPPDQSSLTAVFESSALVMTTWSSVGLDALTFGIPVIHVLSGLPTVYPPELGVVGGANSEGLSAEQVLQAVKTGDRVEYSRRALMWWEDVRSDDFIMKSLKDSISVGHQLQRLETKFSIGLSPRLHQRSRSLEFHAGRLLLSARRSRTLNRFTELHHSPGSFEKWLRASRNKLGRKFELNP